MRTMRSIILLLVFTLVAAGSFVGPTMDTANAASGMQQPPPPPPMPPTTTAPGEGTPPSPDASPSQQDSADAPPEPRMAPSAAEPLPDPEVSASSQDDGVSAKSIAVEELEVVVDRGCPSEYTLNDPIRFIGRRGDSQEYGYWLYMEIWNSTNNAWWSRLAADWVPPNGSLSRSGRIAEPVGQEQLYARLINERGVVVDEAWCEYRSVRAPQPPSNTISCNQSVSGSLGLNEQDKWTFYGNGGQNVRISMESTTGLDTYLELRGPSGGLIASNDDINAPYDLSSRMQVRLPSTGTYTIVARGFKFQAGEYTLSVSCSW